MDVPRRKGQPVWVKDNMAYMQNDKGQYFRRKLDNKNFIYYPWEPIEEKEVPLDDENTDPSLVLESGTD